MKKNINENMLGKECKEINKKTNNMKRFIISTAILAAMMVTLSACGDEKTGGDETTNIGSNTTEEVGNEENEAGDDQPQTAEISPQSLADEILSSGDFKDQLAVIDSDMALTRLYALDANEIETAAFYTNSNATAEEIAVIEVKNAEYTEAVETAFLKRVEEQKEACENYLPDELPKLDMAVIFTSGNYVVLCVSNDATKIEAVLTENFQ